MDADLFTYVLENVLDMILLLHPMSAVCVIVLTSCVILCVTKFVGQGHRSKVKVMRLRNILMGISVEWLFIDGDAKEGND